MTYARKPRYHYILQQCLYGLIGWSHLLTDRWFIQWRTARFLQTSFWRRSNRWFCLTNCLQQLSVVELSLWDENMVDHRSCYTSRCEIGLISGSLKALCFWLSQIYTEVIKVILVLWDFMHACLQQWGFLNARNGFFHSGTTIKGLIE